MINFSEGTAQVQLTLTGFTNYFNGAKGETFNPGIGFEGDVRYIVDRKPYAFGGRIGYINQPSRTTEEINVSTFHIGAYGNYYLRKEEVRPYLGLGIGIFGIKNVNPFAVIQDPKFDQTRKFYPGISPTVGAQYMISDVVGLDAKVNYLFIPTKGKATSSIGIFFGLVLQFGVY
jgi:hypothetical protein